MGWRCHVASPFSVLETVMTKATDSASGDLAADLAALRQDVSRLAETLGQVQHQTQAAGTHVSDTVGAAMDAVTNTATDAQRRVLTAGRDIEASVERYPLTAIAIAFGIGLSFGLISRSRG
jgi:ElaB/YqjD/DUF883 family membrane-anchored ribosome-binding protein